MIERIDPKFSVWGLVARLHEQSIYLKHRITMKCISNEIEDITLSDGEKTRLFSGFQRMSKFIPQIPRYKQLAEIAESIHVFGFPDIQPPDIPGIEYVYLSAEDALTNEWFIVSYSQGYASTLVAEEITDIDIDDDLRMFKGVWTFDLAMSEIVAQWLSNLVGLPEPNSDILLHDNERQLHLLNNTLNRLLLRISRRKYSDIVQGELKSIIKNGIYPEFLKLSGADFDAVASTQEREVVILFSDLRNFSSIAEQMNARELVETVINPYLSTVSRVIYEQSGVVDKFLGDGVLAVFGLDASDTDAEDHAVNAALQILHELEQDEGKHYPLPVGIGIARGKVMIGQIGSKLRSEQTVIGDAVNTAQRLSQFGNNDAWVSYTVYDRLKQRDYLEPKGTVLLKGKAQPHQVYRVGILPRHSLTREL